MMELTDRKAHVLADSGYELAHGQNGFEKPARVHGMDEVGYKHTPVEEWVRVLSRNKKEAPARVTSTDERKGLMEFTSPIGPMIPQNRRFLQEEMAVLLIQDVNFAPHKVLSARWYPTVEEAAAMADSLAKESPSKMYQVYDDEMNNVTYGR